jgi:hypothetical protein
LNPPQNIPNRELLRGFLLKKENRKMIKLERGFFYIVFILLTGISLAQAQPLAFPGAEGYGRFATGGRTAGNKPGEVVLVTTLEDNATNPPVGSFRWALNQGRATVVDPILGPYVTTVPLTIVFRVGGVIHLKSDIKVTRSNLTIAGQTAPGDGICFRGYTVNFSGSKNIIVRYLRFRPGDESGGEVSSFRIENGGNFIIDHCSMSWAIEEATHFSSNENTTVQWCIISEALYNSIHKKGERGYAAQWGGEYASYHHNLLAHHNSRMPRINGSNKNDIEALVDYRNNVNYNWGSSGAFYGGEWEGTSGKGFCYTNVVNNYFKPGPATSGSNFASPSLNRTGEKLDGYAKWYFNGNVMEGNASKTADNWLGVDAGTVGGAANIRSNAEFAKTDGVLEAYSNYTQSATDAYVSVLDGAGATLPKRDTHDTRIVGEVKGDLAINRFSFTTSDGQATPIKGVKNGIIDTQKNLVSEEDRTAGKDAWSNYASVTSELIDTDKDGMPDSWEVQKGLNPNDYADHRIVGTSGYSNLEIYLAELTGIKVDVSSIKTSQTLKVFPNPTNGSFTIETSKAMEEIIFIDIAGKELFRQYPSSRSATINFSEVKNGFYLVKVKTDEGLILTEKVIKR